MKRLLPVLMVFGVFLGSIVPERADALVDTVILGILKAFAPDKHKSVEDPDQLHANESRLLETNACPKCFLEGISLEGKNLKNVNLEGASPRHLVSVDVTEGQYGS